MRCMACRHFCSTQEQHADPPIGSMRNGSSPDKSHFIFFVCLANPKVTRCEPPGASLGKQKHCRRIGVYSSHFAGEPSAWQTFQKQPQRMKNPSFVCLQLHSLYTWQKRCSCCAFCSCSSPWWTENMPGCPTACNWFRRFSSGKPLIAVLQASQSQHHRAASL